MSEDFIIKIKADLDAGNFDAAKQKLDGLTASTKQAQAATGGNNNELSKAAQNLGRVREATQGLNQGLSGLSVTGRSLAGVLGGLGAKLSLIASAFGIGWKIGEKVGEILKVADALTITFGDQDASAITKARHNLEKLDQTRLDGLLKSIDKIDSRLADFEVRQSAATKIANIRLGAEMDLKQQQVDALPEGPDKERAQISLDYQKKNRQRQIDERALFEGVVQRRQAVDQREIEAGGIRRSLKEGHLTPEQKDAAKARLSEIEKFNSADEIDMVVMVEQQEALRKGRSTDMNRRSSEKHKVTTRQAEAMADQAIANFELLNQALQSLSMVVATKSIETAEKAKQTAAQLKNME